MVQFRKRLISREPYEACAVFDVNNDGVLDIFSGAYWYEGPDFEKKHLVCDIEPMGEYFDDFSNIPLDVNGDGYLDIITASFWSKSVKWRRNPGVTGEKWETNSFGESGHIETIRVYDIDGCGVAEIFPNIVDEPQTFFKLVTDENGKGMGKFQKIVIGKENADHGMGFADINGDGRMDIILNEGWLEQPEDPYQTPWEFHKEFNLGRASIPMLGYDVNENGLCDIIYGEAHDYGLYWLEQQLDSNGVRSWIKHEIDMSSSQLHDMMLVDLDLDGHPELVTGKRFRAHNDGDPGAHDPVGFYYYKIKNGQFEKHVIDYGPAEEASGCGIYFWAEDLTGNGYPDLVAPGKEGLYLFENLGSEEKTS